MSFEPVRVFCEQFHLWVGLPFLARELWHMGLHLAHKRGIKHAVRASAQALQWAKTWVKR